MPRIRKVSAALLDERQTPERAMSPAQRARLAREQQFRQLIDGLTGPDDVYAVQPTDGEKATTVRAALTRVIRDTGKNVIVRKHENGFLVALSTPEREKGRRGRRPKSASVASSDS